MDLEPLGVLSVLQFSWDLITWLFGSRDPIIPYSKIDLDCLKIFHIVGLKHSNILNPRIVYDCDYVSTVDDSTR